MNEPTTLDQLIQLDLDAAFLLGRQFESTLRFREEMDYTPEDIERFELMAANNNFDAEDEWQAMLDADGYAG